MVDGAFADLRKLTDWFAGPVSRQRSTMVLERLARRLGVTAVPLLGRELRQRDAVRREAARAALAILAATDARTRVVRELRGVTEDATDEAKVCALGLLAELGEHGAARFADPLAIQRRSALALAAQLDGPADVAGAVDLMMRQLAAGDIVQMLDVLVEAAPDAARRLATELVQRLDLDDDLRDAIRALVATPAESPPTRRHPRPTHVAVLVDAAARIVVVASRKVSGERRWRRWAVLIGATGCIDDCLHEDEARDEDADNARLIASLCADGYRVASTDPDHARTVVASAVRRTSRAGNELASAYYLGRDLLDLRDAHVLRVAPRDLAAATLGQAVEALAAGDPGAAIKLLDTIPPSDDVCRSATLAATRAACLLASGDLAGAIAPLEIAIAGEPAWPLHHWNLAVALHRLGDLRTSYHVLRRFVATSAAPTGLVADPDQPGRVACAERMLGEIERAARLAGTSLARPRSRQRKSKKRAR